MECKGLKDMILDHLHDVYLASPKRWVRRKDMEKRPEFRPYSGKTFACRCQELAQDKIVHVFRQKVGRTEYAFYRYKPQRTIVWKRKKSHEGSRVKA